MEIDKLFNPKKTIFLGMDEQGRIQARGRFFGELSQGDYTKIKSCSISGYKKKNLMEVIDLFPNLIEITIEKNSNLISLEGIKTLSDLRQLTIEDCPKLLDLSELSLCKKLSEVRMGSFKTATRVLSFLSPDILKDLTIHGNLKDLDEINKFENLDYLTVNGYGCEVDKLPLLPKIGKSFTLEGFPKLKDASFMENFTPNIRITWWGPKPILGIPNQLMNLDTFK